MSGTEAVRHDGLTFRCQVDGTSGEWIVFSNSIVTDLSIWDSQVEALKDRYRILRYDQRGHGGTDVPPGPCTFDQLGGDARALMDHFGVDRCTFVGLSMGVPTTLSVYASQPERIRRLVLCDGQAATAATGAATWQERIVHAETEGMEAVADATVARWFAPAFAEKGGADRVRRGIAAMQAAGFAACARALQNYQFAHVLETIAVPTLLIAGANDGGMPAGMRKLSERIAGSRFVEIPDAGHIPNVENAAAFNRALMAFLAETADAE